MMINLPNPKLKKLRWCLALTVAAALSLQIAQAQTFPTKPVKIVVPNAAGGAADLTARAVGQKMSEAMEQNE